MTELEMKVDALAELAMASTKKQEKAAMEKLKKLMDGEYVAECTGVVYRDPGFLIRQVLLELGAPDHLIGHPYAVQAVKMVVEDQMAINNITLFLYPAIAEKFDTNAGRVERAIRHLLEVTWSRGDPDVLMKYFGNTVSPERGRPTNGEFIARMANIVREKMKTGRK